MGYEEEAELYRLGKLAGPPAFDPPTQKMEYGGFLLPTVKERLTRLEEKLDRLLAHLEPKKRDDVSLVANDLFTLTFENQGSPEAVSFLGWSYWLNKTVIVKASAAQDLSPLSRGVIGQVGLIKALMITDSQYGQSADAAVEFPLEVVGGHTCTDLCQPKRGLWFGTTHIEIT